MPKEKLSIKTILIFILAPILFLLFSYSYIQYYIKPQTALQVEQFSYFDQHEGINPEVFAADNRIKTMNSYVKAIADGTFTEFQKPNVIYIDFSIKDNLATQVLGSQAKCHSWADIGSTHCNTTQCLQYTCNSNAEWSEPQGVGVCAAHPDCINKIAPPSTALCDSWALPDSVHCNTDQCQQYTCGNNGAWSSPQGSGVCAYHPDCKAKVQAPAICSINHCTGNNVIGTYWIENNSCYKCSAFACGEQVDNKLCCNLASSNTTFFTANCQTSQPPVQNPTNTVSNSQPTKPQSYIPACEGFSLNTRRCDANKCKEELCTTDGWAEQDEPGYCAYLAECQPTVKSCVANGLTYRPGTSICDPTTCKVAICSPTGLFSKTPIDCLDKSLCTNISVVEEPEPSSPEPEPEPTNPTSPNNGFNITYDVRKNCLAEDCFSSYYSTIDGKEGLAIQEITQYAFQTTDSTLLPKMAIYSVNGTSITSIDAANSKAFAIDQSVYIYKPDQQSSDVLYFNPNYHAAIWSLVYNLYPAAIRDSIDEFIIESDGMGNTGAQVAPSKTCGKINLRVDPVDFIPGLYDEHYNETASFVLMIHEAGHIFATLESQSDALFCGETQQEFAINILDYNECSTKLSPNGCMTSNSVVYTIFDLVWRNNFSDHPEVENEGVMSYALTSLLNLSEREEYYKNHSDEFVSSYATINIHEDFAETFAYYVVGNIQGISGPLQARFEIMEGSTELRTIVQQFRDALRTSAY